MSYDFHAWEQRDVSADLDMLAGCLRAKLSDDVDIEVSADGIVIREGEWTLRGIRQDGSWVADEAPELAEVFSDELDVDQRAVLAESSSRLEFSPSPEAMTDDYYNTWLLASETIASQPGLLVFFPFDGTFMS